jgi:hypothetical protein
VKAESDALVCVSCGSTYAPEERFCPSCHIPLAVSLDADAEPVSERHARARKLKPQLAEGELVRVAGARNQPEAEFIQGLLLEEGVPSILRRTAGFDVPDFLAAGPRDVLVPQAGVETAREVLLQAELISAEPPRPVTTPGRLLAQLIGAVAIGALIVWLVFDVIR